MSWILRLFGISTEDSRLSNLNVSVEIYDTVMERIHYAVSRSNREEGGKLIGKITKNGNHLKITVETYIDSGPHVINSIGHLMPDGEYQEAVFRVLEKFDPNIHYLGSWHTHHCNGLTELSTGDIRSYKETLNSQEYGLDYFFALLVTSLQGGQIQKRYYLFFRDQDGYSELEHSSVHIVTGTSPLESILKSTEEAAFAYRQNRSDLLYTGASEAISRASQIEAVADTLEKIRSADQQWIRELFPSAKPRRAKKDGSIYWEWQISSNAGKLDVCYKHPSNFPSLPANLTILSEGQPILSEDIQLNDSRFKKIVNFLKQAIKKAELTA